MGHGYLHLTPGLDLGGVCCTLRASMIFWRWVPVAIISVSRIMVRSSIHTGSPSQLHSQCSGRPESPFILSFDTITPSQSPDPNPHIPFILKRPGSCAREQRQPDRSSPARVRSRYFGQARHVEDRSYCTRGYLTLSSTRSYGVVWRARLWTWEAGAIPDTFRFGS
ncbi:hypothetical protein PENSPDRAFT_363583 [Peniophora sp. CONT]|nr:hypothetical protein PENSPDRAFT_363583 [Peniophora sp. CONT]